MMKYFTQKRSRQEFILESLRLVFAALVIFCVLLVASKSIGDLIIMAKGAVK